jgi:ribosomal protein L29
MKRNDITEAHGKSVIELQKQLKDAREALATLRLDMAQNKIKNTGSLSAKRKEIAVVLTILKKKLTIVLSEDKSKDDEETKADKGGNE